MIPGPAISPIFQNQQMTMDHPKTAVASALRAKVVPRRNVTVLRPLFEPPFISFRSCTCIVMSTIMLIGIIYRISVLFTCPASGTQRAKVV